MKMWAIGHLLPPPSMKVPPKRKGNPCRFRLVVIGYCRTLNESPSEKEGKYRGITNFKLFGSPSMKVPPKRKGNFGVSRPSTLHI